MKIGRLHPVQSFISLSLEEETPKAMTWEVKARLKRVSHILELLLLRRILSEIIRNNKKSFDI